MTWLWDGLSPPSQGLSKLPREHSLGQHRLAGQWGGVAGGLTYNSPVTEKEDRGGQVITSWANLHILTSFLYRQEGMGTQHPQPQGPTPVKFPAVPNAPQATLGHLHHSLSC